MINEQLFMKSNNIVRYEHFHETTTERLGRITATQQGETGELEITAYRIAGETPRLEKGYNIVLKITDGLNPPRYWMFKQDLDGVLQLLRKGFVLWGTKDLKADKENAAREGNPPAMMTTIELIGVIGENIALVKANVTSRKYKNIKPKALSYALQESVVLIKAITDNLTSVKVNVMSGKSKALQESFQLIDSITDNLALVKAKVMSGKYKNIKPKALFNALQESFFKIGDTEDLVARLRKKMKRG